MISSDLRTMPLADVLQWADGARLCGVLTIERPSGAVWMQLRDREVIACSAPEARGVVAEHLATAMAHERLEVGLAALSFEMLCDQFLDPEDRFRFEPAAAPNSESVALELSIQELVMTGMQYLDEWAEVRALYGNPRARIHRVEGIEPRALTCTQQALLALSELGCALHEARLCLGISQPALLRNTDMLRRLGCVKVEGTEEGADPTEQLVHKALVLVREKQFDEAAHVFAALLATEPGSPRIRGLLRTVEREHVADLYAAMPARAIVRRRARLTALDNRLSRGDRDVVELINDRWDVASLVLGSPLREVETLKSLRKLLRMEAIEIVDRDYGAGEGRPHRVP